MSLLQGDVLPKSLAKHVLRYIQYTCMHLTKFYLIKFPPRQRIYSCSLDFFCADKMYPVRLDQFVLIMGPFDTCPQGWPWSERGPANLAEVLVNDAL